MYKLLDKVQHPVLTSSTKVSRKGIEFVFISREPYCLGSIVCVQGIKFTINRISINDSNYLEYFCTHVVVTPDCFLFKKGFDLRDFVGLPVDRFKPR